MARPLFRLVLALFLAAAGIQGAAQSAVPGAQWERVANPKAAGYCGLDAVTTQLQSMTTTAVTVTVGGRVLFDYGPQDAVSYVASVRKSILAMMYGTYVESGTIRLNATLEELGIDDLEGLLPAEKQATVEDLLTARSGVYHPAANAACTGCGGTMGDPPGARGTVKPGTYFLYNNWDFNALGTIFEKATGQDLYDAFEADFAVPLGMQDFDRSAHRRNGNRRASEHLAYHFHLSTRDMARLGHLMLQDGQWNGRALMPAGWAARMTRAITPVTGMNPESLRKQPFGYGYLWWIWDGPANAGAFRGGYTGRGAIGQFITVLPALDMVVAHKTDRRSNEAVTPAQYTELLARLTAARCAP